MDFKMSTDYFQSQNRGFNRSIFSIRTETLCLSLLRASLSDVLRHNICSKEKQKLHVYQISPIVWFQEFLRDFNMAVPSKDARWLNQLKQNKTNKLLRSWQTLKSASINPCDNSWRQIFLYVNAATLNQQTHSFTEHKKMRCSVRLKRLPADKQSGAKIYTDRQDSRVLYRTALWPNLSPSESTLSSHILFVNCTVQRSLGKQKWYFWSKNSQQSEASIRQHWCTVQIYTEIYIYSVYKVFHDFRA